jgi:TolB-like protein
VSELQITDILRKEGDLKSRFILPLIFLLLVHFLGLAACSSTRSTTHTLPQLLPLASDIKTYTIAVMPFTNLSGQKEYDWLSIGIGEVLTTKLGSLSCFRMVERIKISEALKEIELGQTGLIDEATAPKVGKMIGAEKLVIGSFQISEQNIRIDARLLDVETGRVRVFAGANGELEKIFEVQDRISTSFLAALNIPLSDEEKTLMAAKPTTSMEAFKFYSQAEDIYTPEGRALDDDQRIALLNQSTQIDPGFTMAYLGLGYIYAVNKQDYRQAAVNYNTVVTLQPHNPAPRIWLTRVYLNEGNLSASQQEQKKIHELKRRFTPPNVQGAPQHGRIYQKPQGNAPAAPQRPLFPTVKGQKPLYSIVQSQKPLPTTIQGLQRPRASFFQHRPTFFQKIRSYISGPRTIGWRSIGGKGGIGGRR